MTADPKFEIGCPVDETSCDCIPISVSKRLDPVIVGKPYLSTAEFAGTDPVIEVIFSSEDVKATVAKNILTVSGTTKRPITIVVKATNDCTDCETLTLKAEASVECAPIVFAGPGDIALDPLTGQTSQAYEIIGSKIEVVVIQAPASATFEIEEGYLTIQSVDAGEYKVKLKNDCSETLISGKFTTLADAVCVPLAYVKTIGSPIFEQDKPNTFSWVISGSRPITIEQAPQDLQTGLEYALDTSDPDVTLLTVSGSAILKPCDAEGATSCRQSCFTLMNACKELIVCTTISFAGTPATDTLKFCAGFVTIEEVLPAVAPKRCWKITASRFAADTELYIKTNQLGDNFPDTDPIAIISGDTTISLDSEGAGTGEVCVIVSGSGCAHLSLEAYHKTCAVMSNRARLTNQFQYLDCPPDSGAGAGGGDP